MTLRHGHGSTRVSTLVDEIVAQGANELQGIRFTFKDNEAARDTARAQALNTARARGETNAKAATMKIVGLRSNTQPGSVFTPWIIAGMDTRQGSQASRRRAG